MVLERLQPGGKARRITLHFVIKRIVAAQNIERALQDRITDIHQGDVGKHDRRGLRRAMAFA